MSEIIKSLQRIKILTDSSLRILGNGLRATLQKVSEDGIYPETWIAEMEGNTQISETATQEAARIKRARMKGLRARSFKVYKQSLQSE